jgi:hypothetical protein
MACINNCLFFGTRQAQNGYHGHSATTKDREATLHIYKIFIDTLQFLSSI